MMGDGSVGSGSRFISFLLLDYVAEPFWPVVGFPMSYSLSLDQLQMLYSIVLNKRRVVKCSLIYDSVLLC